MKKVWVECNDKVEVTHVIISERISIENFEK